MACFQILVSKFSRGKLRENENRMMAECFYVAACVCAEEIMKRGETGLLLADDIRLIELGVVLLIETY